VTDEWQKHSIGGLTGYRTREFSLGPHTTGTVTAGTAWGWNPTVAGTKSEDTILTTLDGVKALGEDARWPQLAFEVNGQVWNRPGIFVIG